MDEAERRGETPKRGGVGGALGECAYRGCRAIRRASLSGLFEREVVELDGGIFVEEVAHRPLVGEEADGLVEFVGAKGDAGGGDEGGGIRKFNTGLLGREPLHQRPRRGIEAGRGVVFGLEAVLDDFELEDADGGEERGGRHAGAEVDGLDDTFLKKLVEAGAEFFGV